MKLVRSSISIVCGLPCVTVRSAPAIVFSGPAQRSLTLWPARSPSRLATLYIESSDSFVASAAVSIATGWSEPVPGRELHPLKSSAFHGALLRQQRFWALETRFLESLTKERCDVHPDPRREAGQSLVSQIDLSRHTQRKFHATLEPKTASHCIVSGTEPLEPGSSERLFRRD
jgi:hypothetical protein